ncbi:MAG TPA: hypothetical protein VE978_20715 [Chitinophagales bacterium]|nr:hypothetical protein [Chitinophagales bacterium]
MKNQKVWRCHIEVNELDCSCWSASARAIAKTNNGNKEQEKNHLL